MEKSLIKIWKEKGKILEGIKNSVFKSEHVEEIAAERNAICQSCEHIDLEGSKCFMKGTQPCCGVCGCSLRLLQRSLSSGCAKEKWSPVLDTNEDDALYNHLNNDENGSDI